ncbi:MAG TPA: substrate-binding domain-containing protein [Anaerolineae bacterium]|nr:substrate-binding domain-containing protein [Anaerolineae bacterium]
MNEELIKRATLHDVASLSGVSYQTVSRVINQHPHVAPRTRQKVLQAISQLDYRPNQAAKVLATGRSDMLQLIMYDMRYGDPLPPMLGAARERGYTLLISEINPLAAKEEIHKALQDVANRMIDGLIVFTPYQFIPYEEMREVCRDIPFVFVDTDPGFKAPSVIFDQRHGVALAVEHLIGLGHRQIAEVHGPPLHSDARIRHESFLTALAAHGLEPGPIERGEFVISSGYNATQHLLASDKPFSAIFVGNDRMALGALRALREHGLRVPEDVSIVGYDDMAEAAYFMPPLTTVRQNLSTLAQQSIAYLVSMIQDRTMPIQQRVLYPELIVRASTGPLTA